MKTLPVKLIAALFILILAGCNKKKDTPADPLTTNTWMWSTIDLNPSTNPTGGNILVKSVSACMSDDTMTFGTNDFITQNNGTSHCDPNESATETIPYSIDEVNHVLVVDGFTYTLAEKSSNQIKFYSNLPENSGYKYLVFLLKKQ